MVKYISKIKRFDHLFQKNIFKLVGSIVKNMERIGTRKKNTNLMFRKLR